MYLKQIEQLVALQRIDSEIIELNKELEASPKEVEGLRGQYQVVDERRQQILEKVNLLKTQEHRLASEIEDDTLKVKKSKNKLMMVNNTKEYHAMMREMDNLEKLNRLREEEQVAVIEELKRMDQDMETLDEDSGKLKSNLREKEESLQARVDAAQARLTDLSSRRKEAGKNVPPPVLSRYEFIKSRLAAPVIVPVSAGICAGCHISIPPQSFIELQKGHQILNCPNCQRLIYWSEHFSPEETV